MDKRGRRRTLSEHVILDAALALLAEGGADAVTVRGIAARVGVAPNAVYTYFPDKAAVVRGLAEHLLGRVNHDRFTDPSQPWRDRVRALALELRAELLAHPGSVHLMLGHPPDGPHTRAVRETLLATLADAGLGPADAADASYLVNVHILGSVAFEVAAPPGGPDVGTTRFRWGLDRLLDGLAAHVATGPPR
ncbi:TetR/AcrR family transcriptional regulator [Amycolatopsis sp. NPDC051128]|uniref:TetR/AcrR family transcriptional regulator n=1 Tax=Amycolatopsis sp. NPDC051128 TaxID=3155412 RepID=UPI003414207B